MNNIIISPSLLGANYSKLDEELKRLKEAGISFLHFDVMDGKFVSNTSFSLDDLRKVNEYGFINDVHLMIVDPLERYKDYIDAGAKYLTFHLEAFKDEDKLLELISKIKKSGGFAGISIKPATPWQDLIKYLDKVDLVLVMSVEPGAGGQKFIEDSLIKIKELKDYIKTNNLKALISVDGGVNDTNSRRIIEAGADILVSGSYIFKHESIKEAVDKLCH